MADGIRSMDGLGNPDSIARAVLMRKAHLRRCFMIEGTAASQDKEIGETMQEISTNRCNPPEMAELMRVQPRLASLAKLIGNTHLVAIEFLFRGKRRVLYAKCEQWNLTGSIKDRMAFHILKTAYLQGAIQPSDTIAEATSGNTGISFAALGTALGHPVKIFMPDWMSVERTRLMQSYGATVAPVSREQGGFLGSIAMTEELAAGGGVFLPRQFSNQSTGNPPARRFGGSCKLKACFPTPSWRGSAQVER
jgi:threonine synthase